MVKGGYKKTSIGLIPKDWKFKAMSYAVEINPRYNVPEKDEYLFLEMDSVNENSPKIDGYEKREKNKCTSVKFKEGDVLFARITPSTENGKTALIHTLDEEVAYGSTELIVFSPKKNLITSKFIYYLLKWKKIRNLAISMMEGSTGRQRVPNEIFKGSIRIPLPIIPEQKRITSILSIIDNLIEKTNEKINKTKKLKKGLIQQLLNKGIKHDEFREVNINGKTKKFPKNWDIKMLKKVTDINKNNISTSTPEDYKIEYIDISSINNNGKIEETTFYNYGNAPSRAKRLVNNDDVIVSTVRPYLKSFAIIKEDKENLICSTGFAVLTPKSNMNTEYIYYFVWSNHFVNYMKRLMRGTSYPAVSKNDIANTFIPVPSLEEQKKIASILSSVDSKIKKEEEYKAKLEKLKKGLMQKLLTGEIRVNTDMEV